MATKKSSFAQLAVKPVTSWSISRYHDYVKCPRYFKHKHVDRMKEGTENDAMRRGTAIHKLCELYITGKKLEYKNFKNEKGEYICSKPEFEKFHKEFQDKALGNFQEEFDDLRDVKAEAELQLTYTQGWTSETQWNDWSGAWVRVKLDALKKTIGEATLIDFKTGKIYDKVREQLELYGIAGLLRHPDVNVVKGAAWYLDSDDIIEDEFHRKNLPALIKTWDKRTKAMLSDTTYKEKPGGACTYCPYSKKRGGPCKY